MQVLAKLLTPGRTIRRASGGSKKRLFETIAKIVSADQLSLPTAEVFGHLIAREKLGSTGLGQGIAIPHCRIGNCTHPLGALVTLDEAVDFDAPDDLPVDLLFVLLVPEEAHDQHLEILAGVAGLFRQEAFCKALRGAADASELHRIATTWDS